MSNKAHPNRAAAKKLYIKRNGKVTNKEIAEKFGVTTAQISRWKKADSWAEALEKRRGAPFGNKNAVGSGAPLRNTNAETHGAYTTVHRDTLSEEDIAVLGKFGQLSDADKMYYMLDSLLLKKRDLERRLAELDSSIVVEEGEVYDTMHLDKKIVVDSERGEVTTMVNVSTFERRTVLENELDKTHGRMIRVLKAITDYELKQRAQALAERHYALQKQKITGEFTYNEDGTLDDTYPEYDAPAALPADLNE